MADRVTLGPDGRIALPLAVRQALGLEAGDELLLVRVEDEVRLLPRRQALARARRLVRTYAKAQDETGPVDAPRLREGAVDGE